MTSLVRYTLRAAALHHDDPTDGLSELNSVPVGDPNKKKFCTVLFIGAISDASFESCDVSLAPGQTLLLYTDGIVEARPDGATTFGESALRVFLSERVGMPAAELISELAELVAELRPDDDVALLALTAERPSPGEVR